jgi:hypothetical protein
MAKNRKRQRKQRRPLEVLVVNPEPFDWKFWLKITLFVILFIAIFIIFYLKYIIIMFGMYQNNIPKAFLVIQIILEESSLSGTIFTLLNALIMGMYISVLGLLDTHSSKLWKYVLFIAIIILAVMGLSGIGFRITLLTDFLIYKSYCDNTVEGIVFFISNLPLLTSIYFISFLTESENA